MASHRHHHRTELSVIPDLRFEYSYLKTISRFVSLERLTTSQPLSSAEKLVEEDYDNVELRTTSVEEQSGSVVNVKTSSRLGEVVHVQWKNVIWFTIRDQIVAPFLQGALWGIASYYLTPLSRDLGSKLGHLMPKKEGKVSEGLRTWGKRLIGSSI